MPSGFNGISLALVALIGAPTALGVRPAPEGALIPALVVGLVASAAFLSPVGHSANVLVMGPGGYRFADYTKVGIPLTLLVLVVVLIVLPIFWPF